MSWSCTARLLHLPKFDSYLTFLTFSSFIMSTRTYPAFCSLNQPESQLLSMPVQEPVDQAMNLYPIFDEISWHESLLVTFQLFGQFLSGSAATTPYHSITVSSPAHYPSVTQHDISPGESSTPSPTRKTFSPVSRESSTTSRETVSPEGSYAPPHELTGPVRSKRAQLDRVVHACDECRNKKKKVRSSCHHYFRTSDHRHRDSVPGSSHCV
jgi:hypothetical protein